MGNTWKILPFIITTLFGLRISAQEPNPYTRPNAPRPPTQQGTVGDPTGYGAASRPMSAIPQVDNSVAPLIDLTDPNGPAPTDARGIPTNKYSLEDLGTGRVPTASPEKFSNGSQMGGYKSQARIVEEYRPEKFKVYPDDPDSAWWETNVRFAFARAQREMKPLLLLFTAQWRPEAMNLSQEVFSTKSFNSYVKKNLVICYLNYPRNIKDSPRSMQWAKKEFKVAGYPNVLIFTPKGEVVRAMRGYRKGRPVDYFNELKEVCAPALLDIETHKSELEKQGYRDWHNHEGRVLFAKFLKRDDLLMTLRDGRGQNWTLSLNQLSRDDQMMASSYPKIDEVLRMQQNQGF